jgi:hypothetical protein
LNASRESDQQGNQAPHRGQGRDYRLQNQAIAKAAGCGPRYVQRLAAEPATRMIIAELLQPYQRELEAAIRLALAAILAALKAKHGDPTDHATRLRATEMLRAYLELAQGGEAPPRAGATWEDIKIAYLKYRERQAQDGQT